MPNDSAFELRLRHAAGTWRARELAGPALLRLGEDAWELAPAQGPPSLEAYAALSGAEWRGEVLTIHGVAGSVRLEAGTGLDRAWVQLTALACPLEEFTRGLRSLGSSRSGDLARQARFFTPLLQARRRLEQEADLDGRLVAFAARDLSERISQGLRAIAAEAYAWSAPDRRALEAELFDAAAPLFAELHDLEAAAGRFRDAAGPLRFDAWRAWIGGVAGVFAAADRTWRSAAALLPPPRLRRKRWWRRGGAAAILIALGALGGW